MSISEIQQKIAPILRKYGIRNAAVFGSVSRGTNRPQSDIDLLVKLGKPMGMFAYMRLLRELETALGIKVDLVTENGLNKFIRPYVTSELKTVYEE
ncbi:MAG: hypothetical protein COV91_05600 [Candidatus Taylorbacteria bacterium CG11_big_fil_rev_8_21_14_0_20_46_11]|uniref:Polymerase beta nucleotidyltransferase domain-containing protein n=1 Tax=Candidatus Taylorbacteria bacterium CG11_big_fil_rev_8_21_14_0_20_46_11 TaxID=1975025 RepID=A0A2H0KA83_9BACT|nr:MAG: hypothetical protein COV91_05600 [Candidatus Taylorbacteria bacterium CG11_big_fil_rev_8_21_14_0_20_46_11]